MRTTVGTSLVAAMACGLLGCNASPPTAPMLSAQIAVFRISGSGTIAPGATGRFTAIVDRTDGSSEDVTATAVWRVSSGDARSGFTFLGAGIAQVAADGRPGEVGVRARFNGIDSLELAVLILQPGTYRLSGTVTEEGGSPASAAVEIMSGTGTGLRSTTAGFGTGHYALYGAAGDVELRVSADGLEPQVTRVFVNDQTIRDIVLRPIVPPADVSGSWSVTLSAAAGCRGLLPTLARERTFAATITQQSTKVDVTWRGATIRTTNDVGRILAAALSLEISVDGEYDAYSYPRLFDRINSTQWLGIHGSVRGALTGSDEIRATLSGNLDLYESPPTAVTPPGPPTAMCFAPDHELVLRKQ